MANLLPFLVLKAYAIEQRDKAKDSYNVVWTLNAFGNGPRSAVDVMAKSPAIDRPEVLVAIGYLRKNFQPMGHIVFRKQYNSKSRFLSYRHEQAYLLGKGRPALPKQPVADVIDMPYSGNKLHPTQKPVETLAQLIRCFTLPGELILDPFAGSGSTCAAAMLTGRKYIGVELDNAYHANANARMERIRERIATRGPLLHSHAQ